MPARKTQKTKQQAKHGKRGGALDVVGFTTAAAVAGDAYGDVAGSVFDTLRQGVKTLGFLFIATVQNLTFKVQGSIDGTTWHDCTTADTVGVTRAIDVPVVAGTPLAAILSPFLAPGAAAGAFRFYKAQVKNTVGGVIGTAQVAVSGKQ